MLHKTSNRVNCFTIRLGKTNLFLVGFQDSLNLLNSFIREVHLWTDCLKHHHSEGFLHHINDSLLHLVPGRSSSPFLIVALQGHECLVLSRCRLLQEQSPHHNDALIQVGRLVVFIYFKLSVTLRWNHDFWVLRNLLGTCRATQRPRGFWALITSIHGYIACEADWDSHLRWTMNKGELMENQFPSLDSTVSNQVVTNLRRISYLIGKHFAARLVQLPVLFLAIPVTVVDKFAPCTFGGGNLAACGAGARVIWDLLNSTHYGSKYLL